MNNPDEATAVAQFGKGDKYFGVATLLATLPGLPMVGHGQVEGYEERYGMEFCQPQLDEVPDEGFVAYHDEVIFPLLCARHLFSGVEHFALLDFWREDGVVDENVFAYSNRSARDGARSLVLYNNAPERTRGWVRESTAINVGEVDAPVLERRTLSRALGLKDCPGTFYGLWELRAQRWLLQSGAELAERGLYADLGGYGVLAFIEVRELSDPTGAWARLAGPAGGVWIDSLEDKGSAETDASLPSSEVEMLPVSDRGESAEEAAVDSAMDSDRASIGGDSSAFVREGERPPDRQGL
jgi:hypothetical protein